MDAKCVEISRASRSLLISGPLKTARATVCSVASLSTLVERLLPVAVLAISAISVPVMILAPTGAPRLRALTEEKQRVDVEISRLGDQIRQLRAEVRQLKSDPAKVEQVARDELGLLRRTEIVVQFGQ
jgi:cell division protein FtsB